MMRLPSLITLGLIALAAISAAQQPHESEALSLDTPATGSNPWLFTPLVSTPSLTPGPIVVPGFWSENDPAWDNDWPSGDPRNKEIKKASYSRSFTLPSSMAGKAIRLQFDGVNYVSEVKIDGTTVGSKHYQPFVPFELDVTSVVVPDGTTVHDLEVIVEDHEAPGFLLPGSPPKYDYPVGYPAWAFQGNGICGPVRVLATPKLRVDDVFVETSVAQDTIQLTTTVVNSGTTSIARVWLTHEVYEILSHDPEVLAPTPALTLGTPTWFPMPAGHTEEVVLSTTWSNPKLWMPSSPTLYRVIGKLTVQGVTAHQAPVARFGFREFKVDGNRYSLNGIPFHGWGDTNHLVDLNAWNDREMMEYLIDVYEEYGPRLIRVGAAAPHPQAFYDVCDEKGILCYFEMRWNGQNNGDSKGGHTAYTHNYTDGGGSFEQHADEMIRALVRANRNHPSIVIWSLSNETFLGSPPWYASYGNYRDDLAARAATITALDSTRPIGCDSDGSLGTGSNPTGTHLLAIKNKHYPAPIDVSTIDTNGPDHGLTHDYSNSPDWVFGIVQPDIPLGIGEYMFNKDPIGWNPASPYHPANWGDLRALTLRFYRLAELSDIRPFRLDHDNLARVWYDASPRRSLMTMQHSMSPVAVFDLEYDASGVPELETTPSTPPVYAEGATPQRTYAVLNDDLELLNPDPQHTVNETVAVTCEVSLYGKVVSSSTASVVVPLGEALGDPWDNDAVSRSWTVPEVDADGTPFVVSFRARKSNLTRYSSYYVFEADDTDSSITPGIDPATKKGTFVSTFDTDVNHGWRFHDVWWTIRQGALWQPEVRGLMPNNKWFYNPTLDDRFQPSSKFGVNSKIAGLEPYTYQDLRMSADVELLAVEADFQGAGIGVRLDFPESGPWHEGDPSRRNGYFLKVNKHTSGYNLVLLEALSGGGSANLVTAALPQYSPGQTVRLELEARGSQLSATASCVEWTSAVSMQASDTSFGDEGHVNLIMQERVAATYDNVQVGSAPFAPRLDPLPAQVLQGTNINVAWTQESDWEQSTSTVEYRLDWVSQSGAQTGSSGWISTTSYVVPGLNPGLASFQVFSRDDHGQVSAPSQARTLTVTP